MSDGKSYLVSFEDVHATCGSVDISAITEMRISAQANGVPQITLAVDGANSDGDGAVAADGVSLDNARSIFDTCRSMVRTSAATLSLSMTCKSIGRDGQDVQQLRIEGWLLVDVALSPVQQHGACTASLTFAHPLYKAHLGGMMPGLLTVPLIPSATPGDNPLELFVASLKAYALSPRLTPPSIIIPGAYSLLDVEPALNRHLNNAIEALESSVKWRGDNGLPAASVLGAWLPAMWSAIAEYGTPSAGNSVLQTMLSGLIPECSLALGGDFTSGPLELGPFTPWEEASFEIRDSDVVSLDFPQTDPTPISGVHLMAIAGGDGMLYSIHVNGAQAGDGARPVDIFYVPKSELSAEYMYGPIHQFTEPGWLTRTAECASGLRAGRQSDVATAQDGSFSSASTIQRGGTAALSGGFSFSPSLDYARAALLCAKAFFETSYRKDWGFGVTARLMLSSSGKTLCPGRVVSVVTDSGEAVGGYIVAVEHTISVHAKSATTKIVCTHPRFGELPEVITSRGNALYS